MRDTFVGSERGTLLIQARENIFITDSVIISDDSTPNSNKGSDIEISGKSTVIDSSFIESRAFGRKNAGDIKISSNSLEARDFSIIASRTTNQGNGGEIIVSVADTTILDGFSRILGITQADGDAGNIFLTTNSLKITDGSKIDTITFDAGNAGDININVDESTELKGSRLVFRNTATSGIASRVASITSERLIGRGNAGNINLMSGSLIVTDGAQISVSTFSTGNAGNLRVIVRDKVQLNGFSEFEERVVSGLFSSAGNSDIHKTGNGGEVELIANSLEVENGADIAASTFGTGNAGNVTIKVQDIARFTGLFSSATSDARAGASGRAGNVVVRADFLDVDDGALINASTQGQGDAGNVDVFARRLLVQNGGVIQAATFSDGQAGNLSINAAERVEVVDIDPDRSFTSGLRASSRGSGKAGDLIISTSKLVVQGGGSIEASGFFSGPSGNLTIRANSVLLNRGALLASTAASGADDSANIRLQNLEFLLMKDRSLISAGAFENANGGNVEINASEGFIIAFPNEDSDIIADAFAGNGGNVTIQAQGLFGLEFRERRTPLSDITASSEFGLDGTVQVDAVTTDPTRSLENLPEETADTRIQQTCQASGTPTKVSFFNIGRGGSPSTPEDLLSADPIIEEWTPFYTEALYQFDKAKLSATHEDLFPAQVVVAKAEAPKLQLTMACHH